MRYYIISLIVVLLCSCSSKKYIIGRYASQEKPYCFEFKRDSTFLYEYKAFGLYKYSTGTWRAIEKRSIILNSKISNTNIPLKVDETENFNSKESKLTINLAILGGMNLSNYICHIFINDTLYKIKRCDSLSSILINKPINNVYFDIEREPIIVTSTYFSLPLISETFKPKSKISSLKMEASFSDSLFSYRSFNNEKLKSENDNIKIFNTYTKKWERLPRVPDSTNIFIHFQ